MSYTVNQLARLAGISRRTLHYYDEIGLLLPAGVAPNGYRQYSEADALRLQQILFYRELGLPLERIRSILTSPEFDALQALQEHKQALEHKARKIGLLIQTVDKTILHLKGKANMENKEIFTGFTEEEQKKFELEARQLWGNEQVGTSVKRWNSYSKEKQKQILSEAGGIYQALVENMHKGADSNDVQTLIGRWHQNLRYFYEPTKEILLGLVEAYNDQPGFQKTFRQFHPDLARFMKEAVRIYVQGLP